MLLPVQNILKSVLRMSSDERYADQGNTQITDSVESRSGEIFEAIESLGQEERDQLQMSLTRILNCLLTSIITRMQVLL